MVFTVSSGANKAFTLEAIQEERIVLKNIGIDEEDVSERTILFENVSKNFIRGASSKA